MQASAPAVQVIPAVLRNAAVITDAIESFAREPNGGMIVHSQPVTTAHRHLLAALAAQHAQPAIYPYRFCVEAGGLISYGTDLVERWRNVAGYVDLILRGTPPADLPVQSPTRIELVINLKAARPDGAGAAHRRRRRGDRMRRRLIVMRDIVISACRSFFR